MTALKADHACRYDHPGQPIYAPLFLRQLSARKPANSVVTTDVGQHQMWSAQHMTFERPENFITSSGLGTMGFGVPAAVGAQIARPQDTVICVSGDGSFMMNVQELGTIKRKQLPLKIVLLDNQRLGMVRQWQQLFFDGRYSETNLSDNPDFLMLAAAFGIPGQRISRKRSGWRARSRRCSTPKALICCRSLSTNSKTSGRWCRRAPATKPCWRKYHDAASTLDPGAFSPRNVRARIAGSASSRLSGLCYEYGFPGQRRQHQYRIDRCQPASGCPVVISIK